eukprot:3040436-Ditylum_brightwellii.AAC.1
MQFLHEAVGSPVPSTWINAIDRGSFITWPGLTAANNTQAQHYHSLNRCLGLFGSNTRQMALQPARRVPQNCGQEEQKDGDEEKE